MNSFILRHRTWVLPLFLLLTGLLGYQLRFLTVSKEVSVLFPPHHPHMVLVKRFNKMLASPDRLICILEVRNGDIYTRHALEKIRELTLAVLALPGCDASDIKSITESSVKHMEATAWGVETNPVIFPDLPETPEDFARLRRRVESDAGIRGVYVSYDGTAATVMARWKAGDNPGQLYKDLHETAGAFTDENFAVHFAGAPALSAHLIHLTGQFKTAAVWMAVALIVVLALFLRSIPGVLLSLASLVLSVVWTLGLAAVLMIPVSFLSIVWLLFFWGMTTGLAALGFRYYRQCGVNLLESGAACNNPMAVEIAFSRLSVPVAAGSILTGLCALTLSLSDLPLLRYTGYIGACSAVSGFFIVLVFTPAVLSFLPGQKGRGRPLRDTPDTLPGPLTRLSRAVIGLTALALVAVGGTCGTRLVAGDNEPGSAFFFPGHPYNRAFSFFNEKFIGGYNMTVVAEGLQKGALNDFSTMSLIGEFQQYLEDETDARACISMAMMIRFLNRIYHEGNPKWSLIPKGETERSALGGAIKMGGTAGKWMDDTWTNGSIQAMYGSDENVLIERRLAKAREFISSHPSDRVGFRLCAGFLGVIKAMDDAGSSAFWQCTWTALALAFLSGVLVYRRPGPALVLFISVITAQAAAWIFMAFQGICISIHSAPAAPLSMGLGAALCICLMPCFGQKPGPEGGLRPPAGFVLIPAAMLLPWAFVSFRFMAEAAGLIAVSIIAQFICSIVIARRYQQHLIC